MLRELTSLSLNINNDTLILSSMSEADPVTGGPAYKLSPSLLLGSHIQTMGELVVTNSHSRIPDPAMQLRNCSNDSPQCQSTQKTIIVSDNDNDNGSQYKSTQDVFVLSDDDDDDNMNVILTHQSSYKPPHSTKCTTCQCSRLSFHLARCHIIHICL